MEKKLLITGFEPFGGQTVNPSWEAVRRLPEVISEFRLVKMEVPVLFGGAVSGNDHRSAGGCGKGMLRRRFKGWFTVVSGSVKNP